MELNIAAVTEAIAARHADRECIVFRDRRFDWADVNDRTRRLARVLHDAGLGMTGTFGDGEPWESVHDHVGLYLLNGNEYIEGMLGAWKARCASFNVNYRYVAEELRYLFDDAAASAVIIAEQFAPVFAEVLDGLRIRPRVILQVADGSGQPLLPGAIDYEAALAAADPELPAALVESWSGDDLYLCYTGGTTGMPKGAMWRQADFVVSALGVTRPDGSDYETLDEIVDRATGTARVLPAPPLMHGAAHWNALSALIAGGTVIIQDVVDRIDADDVLTCVARCRASALLIVGDPIGRPLADAIRAGDHDLSSLRHLLSGGAVLSPTLRTELLDLLPGIRIIDVLGSTESGRQGVANHRRGDDASTSFSPSPTAVVLSEDRTRVLEPRDAAMGWLAQTGRVPLGYLGDPDKSRATFPVIDGIRHSVAGDRAQLRPDGSIVLLGRDSVTINTGGEKVFAEEVETALKTHPAVFDAVVCGRPSERWGSEVVAIVQLRPGPAPGDDDLLEAVDGHLARFKRPKEIIRIDHIVRSPSGKADYRWAASIAAGPTSTSDREGTSTSDREGRATSDREGTAMSAAEGTAT